MINLSMNEYTTKEWTFEEDVRYYSNAGYNGIGVIREKIENHNLNTVVKLIKANNLIVTEVCSAGHLVCKDRDTQKHFIKDAIHAIQIAGTLEAKSLILLAGFEPSFDYVQSIAALHYSIEELLPVAEYHNVRLALEPLHPMYKTSLSFLISLGEALSFIEQFRSSHLGIWLDTQHVWWDTKVSENIIKAGDNIFGVHINDCFINPHSFSDWGMPGKGVIPLNKIFSAIALTRWNGMYSVEVISDRIRSDEYPEILKYCSEWFAGMSK